MYTNPSLSSALAFFVFARVYYLLYAIAIYIAMHPLFFRGVLRTSLHPTYYVSVLAFVFVLFLFLPFFLSFLLRFLFLLLCSSDLFQSTRDHVQYRIGLTTIAYIIIQCVCVVIPFILDVRLVDARAGVTQDFSTPSFCGARLHFYREKDSAVPFPRRP